MIYLLDTNIFGAIAAPIPDKRATRLFQKHAHAVAVAAPVYYEMTKGIARLAQSKRRRQLEAFMVSVVEGLPLLAYDEKAARWHGEEAARLEKAGRTPPVIDAQIAAIAAVHDAVVVTGNTDDFADFNLPHTLENWLTP